MPGTYDRFTVNWAGDRELEQAQAIRQRVKARGSSLNALMKTLLVAWLREQEHTSGGGQVKIHALPNEAHTS